MDNSPGWLQRWILGVPEPDDLAHQEIPAEGTE